MLFGQKAQKWLKLASVNTASGVHKSSPKLGYYSGVEAESRCYTRIINYSVMNQEGEYSRVCPCKIAEGWEENNNQSLWLCQCSAVGARLNSVLEMKQTQMAPGHCLQKGFGRLTFQKDFQSPAVLIERSY